MLWIEFWYLLPEIVIPWIHVIRHQPTLQAVEAVNAILEATSETPSYMIAIRENKVKRVPLMEAVEMVCLRLKHLWLLIDKLID